MFSFIAIVTAFSPTIPVPSAPQLKYQQHEIMALIHFNMATFAGDGDPGCNAGNWNTGVDSSNPASFNPVKLNIDNWATSMLALGAKHAVLTAKHGCGHLLWPTKVPLPDGRPYTYCVGKNESAIKHDILADFSKTMQKYGIGHGFYYSLTNNFYLNVASHNVKNTTLLPGQELVTQNQFEKIAFDQVSELWKNYGSLTEIWFDGGYSTDMKTEIETLLASSQPNSVAFNGVGVSPNPVCWVGTESGAPGGEVWSTGSTNLGDPNSTIFCPKGCDTTLQEGDHWFYTPGDSIRSLKELIDVYHGTVGRNGMLELDFAINRDGLVEPSHAARYQEFGGWISGCYEGGAVASSTGGPGLTEITLHSHPESSTVDRIMIQEDLSKGQRVRSYVVDYLVQGKWVIFSQGHSIGNKRIDLGDPIGPWSKFRLRITESVGAPQITKFAVFAVCPGRD